MNEYQDKLTRLHRQLLAARLLSGGYDAETVDAWMQSWQQLAQAIESGQEIWLEGHCRQAVKQPAFWKNGTV
jgi:triphosphatase